MVQLVCYLFTIDLISQRLTESALKAKQGDVNKRYFRRYPQRSLKQ